MGETGGSGEKDVKNSGDLQRAKRICEWRDIPAGEMGRGWSDMGCSGRRWEHEPQCCKTGISNDLLLHLICTPLPFGLIFTAYILKGCDLLGKVV